MNDDRPQRFKGKTVLVAGGAQGMGRACAELLAAEGAHLALFDIEADNLARTLDELATPGTASRPLLATPPLLPTSTVPLPLRWTPSAR